MPENKVNQAIDIALKLAVLVLLAAWCFQILSPFLNPVLWGIIIAVALDPVYAWLLKITKGKVKLSAFLIVLVMIGLILVPSIYMFESAISGLRELNEVYESGELIVPAANESVQDWPVIGETIYGAWDLAAKNLEGFLGKYQDQLTEVGKFLISALVGTGTGLFQLVLSLIIAGVLLATPGTQKTTEALFQRLAGSFGTEFVAICQKTIHNVVKGILGVAIIQSLLVGAGFYLAEVPYAGLWAILVLILAVIQLPPTLIIIPVVVYLFSAKTGGMATVWSVYLFLAGASDNILKPILMGRGAAVPMLVIFLGSLGGFIAFGFIGLFVGAIVLSLAYKLLLSWLGIAQNDKKTAA